MKLYLRSIAVLASAVVCAGCDGAGIAVESEDSTLEILDNLIAAGFPENDIQVTDEGVYVGLDALVTLEASREMVPDMEGSGGVLEQYRTNNLVSRNLRTICIDGRQFSGKLSRGLNWAIANYNRLNLTFSMRRIGSNRSGCDAVITGRAISGTGGSAGFPSGGRPFGTINIGTGNSQFSTDTVEHIIGHELGHCIGFRHSDYFNRSISCNTGGNEGSGGVGAILIPGTPSGATVGGSLMNSCFRSSGESGEFTSTDVTALQQLY